MNDALRGVHHVALSVTDLDRSRSWYCSVLGLEVAFEEQSEGRRGCVLRFPQGGFAVGLVEHGEGDGTAFDHRRTGLDHFAVTVTSRAGLDAWQERLDGAGVPHSGVIDIPVGAILNTKDPDGIALAFFWDGP